MRRWREVIDFASQKIHLTPVSCENYWVSFRKIFTLFASKPTVCWLFFNSPSSLI